MVEQARKQKDIIRLNCVMDKLAQVKVSMNIGDEAMQELQQSAGRNDDGASLHEYTRMTIVDQKVQVLQNEARPASRGAELRRGNPGGSRGSRLAREGHGSLSLEPPPLERPPAASTYQ